MAALQVPQHAVFRRFFQEYPPGRRAWLEALFAALALAGGSTARLPCPRPPEGLTQSIDAGFLALVHMAFPLPFEIYDFVSHRLLIVDLLNKIVLAGLQLGDQILGQRLGGIALIVGIFIFGLLFGQNCQQLFCRGNGFLQ